MNWARPQSDLEGKIRVKVMFAIEAYYDQELYKRNLGKPYYHHTSQQYPTVKLTTKRSRTMRIQLVLIVAMSAIAVSTILIYLGDYTAL